MGHPLPTSFLKAPSSAKTIRLKKAFLLTAPLAGWGAGATCVALGVFVLLRIPQAAVWGAGGVAAKLGFGFGLAMAFGPAFCAAWLISARPFAAWAREIAPVDEAEAHEIDHLASLLPGGNSYRAEVGQARRPFNCGDLDSLRAAYVRWSEWEAHAESSEAAPKKLYARD